MTNLDRGPISLQTKMACLLAIYFFGLYLMARFVGSLVSAGSEAVFIGFALVFITLLNLGGPALLEQRMRIRWLSGVEAPRVAEAVSKISRLAGLPEPRIGESSLAGANAFAFGRTKRDGRICLTRTLLSILNDDELGAVIAHEVSHVKNWDVTIITLLSVVPVVSQAVVSIPEAVGSMIGSLPARLLFHGLALALAPIVWLVWLVLIPVNWFATLLMNYGSRVRELNADRDAVELGIKPHHLASALFKVSRSESDRSDLQLVAARPLLLAIHAQDFEDRTFLRQLDADNSGDISAEELAALRGRRTYITLQQRVAELFSSHPLIQKRFQSLAEMT